MVKLFQITVKFVFYSSAGNWRMPQVEVDDGEKSLATLDAVGKYPSAPNYFSYACYESFVFKNREVSLTISHIQVWKNYKFFRHFPVTLYFQVQPNLSTDKFSKPYDCVGIMTPGIISGIFVAFILGTALTIAITAILDIKTPNRFESRSSKQLTFTVQE